MKQYRITVGAIGYMYLEITVEATNLREASKHINKAILEWCDYNDITHDNADLAFVRITKI